MALGALFLAFVVMCILAVVGTVLLFAVKKPRTNDVLLVLMAAYSVTIAFLGATAQPVNFIGPQIFSWAVGAVAVVGVAVRFLTKKQHIATKILVAASVLVGIYGLYFS